MRLPQEAYWRAYDESLALWPTPYTPTLVDTPQGRTHVISSGDAAGVAVVLLHAASLSAVQWSLQASALGARYRLLAVDIVGDIGRSSQTAPIRSRGDAAACERIVRPMEMGVAGFRYDRAAIFPSELPDSDLRRLGCPALVLVGEAERIYRAGEAVERACMMIPHASAEVMPGLGHLLGMQDPHLVNGRILRFLQDDVD